MSAIDEITVTDAVQSSRLGQTLIDAREKANKTLSQCAQDLRIRQPYLQALETGDTKSLPSGTYAVGFLRTYADYLGLDGEEMVRRFRTEATDGFQTRASLVFPSPVSEGRIPSGGILMVGVVLAAVAYGGWYLFSTSSDTAELVPALPERLSSVLSREAQIAKPEPTPAPAVENPQPAPQAAAVEPAPVAPAAPEPVKAPEAPKAPEPVKTPEPVKAPEPAKAPETPKAEAKPVEVKPEAPKAEPAATPVAPAPAPVAAAPVVPPAPAPVAAPAPAAVAAPAAEPIVTEVVRPVGPEEDDTAPIAPVEGTVYGATNVNSRLVIHAATADCWVEVREMDGQVVFKNLLRKGDRYQLPNRPGLSLKVGNAGVLDVLIDGAKGKTLGEKGQVRTLEVDSLLGR